METFRRRVYQNYVQFSGFDALGSFKQNHCALMHPCSLLFRRLRPLGRQSVVVGVIDAFSKGGVELGLRVT